MFCNAVRRLVLTAILTTTAAIAACGRDMPVGPVSIGDSSIGASSDLVSPMGITQLQVGQSLALPAPSGFSRNRNYEWASDNPSVIVVNSSGVVYAVGPGAVTITASSAGVAQQYVVSVQGPSVIGYTLTPKTGTPLPPGATRQFVPEVLWSDGAPRSAITAWELPLGGGSISQLGAFTAGSMAGTFLVVAHCVCGLVDSAFVEVSEPAQLQKLTISPKSVTLAPGEERQFTVSANWSTGATDAPPVVWSASGGSVSAGGVYVAPGEAGSYRVVVRHAGGVASDTAVVTIASNGSGGGGDNAGDGDDTPKFPDPSLPVPTWEISRDFNSGPLGAKAERTPDGFDDVAGRSVYSDSLSYEGGRAARLSIDSGATGWGHWGGALYFPSVMRRGHHLWLNLYVYIPSDFVIKTPGVGILKFLRIHTVNASGDNAGYDDVYINDDGTTGSQFRFIKEGQDIWYRFGANQSLTRDRWHRFTVHYSFDSKPRAQGGDSFVQIWQNGDLILDEDRVKTLSGADHRADYFLLFTYWNGSSPRTQSVWVDDIKLADNMPDWAKGLPGIRR